MGRKGLGSVVFITCILSCILSCSAQNFIGVWDDLPEGGGYGGNLYICQSGNDFFGAYSEAGILIGKVSGYTVEGNWYEGGSEDADYDCYFGKFSFTLSVDGSAFSGYWTCDGDSTGNIFILFFQQKSKKTHQKSPQNMIGLPNDLVLNPLVFTNVLNYSLAEILAWMECGLKLRVLMDIELFVQIDLLMKLPMNILIPF
jgi:hypothetical protein